MSDSTPSGDGRRPLLAAVALAGLIGAACGQGPAEPSARAASATTGPGTAAATTGPGQSTAVAPTPTSTTTGSDPSAATAAPSQSAAVTPGTTTSSTGPAQPAFSIAPIDDATAQRMTYSWRAGCPVPLADLRLLTLGYLGFDGQVHRGEMVVHADAADAVVGVFRELYDARFPIERMELVDVYAGNDDLSTMANNTSAFNCRAVTGGSRWSEHAYGRAIDVNPVQNPYVYSDGHVLDPQAQRYTDRSVDEPGLIHDGDLVVQAFTAIGWSWGGDFSSVKDYQHFSATGR